MFGNPTPNSSNGIPATINSQTGQPNLNLNVTRAQIIYPMSQQGFINLLKI